jgi:hypothetical protein
MNKTSEVIVPDDVQREADARRAEREALLS